MQWIINQWLLWNFSNYCSSGEKKDQLSNLAYLGFLCVTLLINLFSSDSLLLKSLVPSEKKQFLGPVLVFEQRIKQRQLKDVRDRSAIMVWEVKSGAKVLPVCSSLSIKVE